MKDLVSAALACVTNAPVVPIGSALVDVGCRHCGHSGVQELFDRAALGEASCALVHCPGCSLVFLHPSPTAEEIDSFYDHEYHGHGNAKFGPITELFVYLFRLARVRALRSMGIRQGRVLDVGCARGVFLDVLRSRGYDVFGTELNLSTGDAARQLLGTDRVHIGGLEDAPFRDGEFDAITAWHVFEHLPNPEAALESFHRLLRPGGVILLSMPNIESWQARWAGIDWFHLDLPRHLYHYTPATLRILLERHGFAVTTISHYSLEQNPFGLLQSLLHRLGAPRLGLFKMLRGSLDCRERRRLQRLPAYSAYLTAFPIAAVVSSFWSLLGFGATFTVLARRVD